MNTPAIADLSGRKSAGEGSDRYVKEYQHQAHRLGYENIVKEANSPETQAVEGE